jgi:hypothetical protein
MQPCFQKSPKIKVIADAGQQPVDKMMVTVKAIKKCNQKT